MNFRDALPLIALWNFAVAQPIFDILSKNTEFFVSQNSKPVDLILLALILSLICPLVLYFIESLIKNISNFLYSAIHLSNIAILLIVFLMQLLKQWANLPAFALLAIAIALAGFCTFAYHRFSISHVYFKYLFFFSFIFIFIFLFVSPARKILFTVEQNQKNTFQVNSKTPIIMIILDEFSVNTLMNKNQRIDNKRYPGFGELAASSYWFRNATTVADDTKHAIPALLTGRYPDYSKLARVEDYPNNLFTFLKSSYNLKVIEAETRLCPKSLIRCNDISGNILERMVVLLSDISVMYFHISLPYSIAKRFPSVTHSWKNFLGLKSSEYTLLEFSYSKNRHNLVNSLTKFFEPESKPTLYFYNLPLPHHPWEYMPSGKRYRSKDYSLEDNEGLKSDYTWSGNEWHVAQGYQRYLLQVSFVDRLIDQLISKLKETDMFEKSLIVLCADHGCSFRPNDSLRWLTPTNWCDIAGIPLFIKVPHQKEGFIIEKNVEIIDVLPTIFSILKISDPWEMDGVSAIEPTREERLYKTIYSVIEKKYSYENSKYDNSDSIQNKISLFGEGGQADDLFRIGPHTDLINKKIEEVGIGGISDITIKIFQPSSLYQVHPSFGFLPLPIRGRVLNQEEKGKSVPLAICLNGIISATTIIPIQKGQVPPFSAMIPERYLKEGFNHLQIFVVSQNKDGKPELKEVKGFDKTEYTLKSSNGATEDLLLAPDGTFTRLESKALVGNVELAKIETNKIEPVVISGWAIDLLNLKPAKKIIIFQGNQFYFAGTVGLYRQDIAAKFGDKKVVLSGFEYKFHPNDLKWKLMKNLRFFAISENNICSELPISSSPLPK
ncbi:MAG: sulfatase-like hydrolase/transferase [bacterium]